MYGGWTEYAVLWTKEFGLQRYKDLKIWVCGKDSIPLLEFIWDI